MGFTSFSSFRKSAGTPAIGAKLDDLVDVGHWCSIFEFDTSEGRQFLLLKEISDKSHESFWQRCELECAVLLLPPTHISLQTRTTVKY